MNSSLPFDTTKFNELPTGIIICQPVLNADGSASYYRIVFGNEPFADIWKNLGKKNDFIGALIDENFLTEKFSSMPLKNLPEPFVGFMLIDTTEHDKKFAHDNFLQIVHHAEGAILLLRDKNDGTFEVVFVSKDFSKLIDCRVDKIMTAFKTNGVIAFTHPDDRLAIKRMLRRRVSEEGTKDLTIRQMTARGEMLWCNVTFTFIDDFDEHYILCNFFDVTSLKAYAQRLQKTYMSIGDNFYRANARTLSMFRANITRNRVEDVQGKDMFGTDSVIRPYSELINLRAKNYPIDEEREKFLATFNAENIKLRFQRGETQLSMYLFSRRKDGNYCYVNYRAVFTRHPITNEIIIFVAEQEAGKEKVEGALLDKILARQFDMVAYLANEKYSVVVGDSALITKGSIFPKTREGFYDEYLNNQVIPVLDGDDDTKKNLIDALKLSTIREKLKVAEPYVVNIACNIDGEIFYKRLDFYVIDPRADFFIVLKSDTTEIQQKQIEQNNRLKDALTVAKQANVAKTAFLSRMSHEIRTPMNAIIGLDNIALHDKEITPTIKGYLEKIGTSARYLLSIINDILDMRLDLRLRT